MTLVLGFGAGVRVQAEGRRSWQQQRYTFAFPEPPTWGWGEEQDIFGMQSRLRGGAALGGAFSDIFFVRNREAPEYPGYSGARTAFEVVGVISGVTRDNSGVALGNVVLKIFRTADNVLVTPPGEFQSDTDGTYRQCVGVGNHFIYAHKDDVPNLSGSSDNNLVGT